AAARCTARDVGDPHGAAQCRARAFPHPQGAAQDGPAGRQVAGFFRKKRMKSITYVISSLTAAMIAVPAGAQAPLPAAPKSPLEERRPAAAPAPATPAAKPSSGALECLVEPFMVVNVGSSVDGVLARVAVDRGDVVRKGQVVATLQSGVEAAAVALSQARVEFAQRKVERNEALHEKQLIS